MTIQTAGIHHITAFAGDPQANVDFYAGVLGLRLVKKQLTSMHLMYIICTLETNTEARVPSSPSSHRLDHHGAKLAEVRSASLPMSFLLGRLASGRTGWNSITLR